MKSCIKTKYTNLTSLPPTLCTFFRSFFISWSSPYPSMQLLSASLRNRVFDGIATILAGSHTAANRDVAGDRSTEKCLFWILALFRRASGSVSCNGGGGQSALTVQEGYEHPQKSLFIHLAGHTKRDLKESLQHVSLSRSKEGLLAALLLHYF